MPLFCYELISSSACLEQAFCFFERSIQPAGVGTARCCEEWLSAAPAADLFCEVFHNFACINAGFLDDVLCEENRKLWFAADLRAEYGDQVFDLVAELVGKLFK